MLKGKYLTSKSIMKSSNIKTTFSAEQAGSLPQIADDIVPGTLKQLTEGHFSQAFSYETGVGEKRVLRLGRKLYSFEADKYAHEHFNSDMIPVPEVIEIGEVESGLYYCVSEFADGTPSDQLSRSEFDAIRDNIDDTFAAIFRTDISGTTGWGKIDRSTGNGQDSSYVAAFEEELHGLDRLKIECEQHGIDPGLVDAFASNLRDNLPKIEVSRRLTHADFGFDNVIVKNGKVSAIIDWSGMGYGDWLHDYSRLEFWHPGRHAPAIEFARRYGLDTQTFSERWLVHMAENALTALRFAFKYEESSTRQWLKEHLAKKLDPSILARNT
jgi:hygromycin-B 4-O-kinase